MSRLPKRPRLTRKIIEALQFVASDAAAMVDERAGNNSALPTDEKAYQGLEYLGALIDWYDATHPESRPKPAPAPPVEESRHDPSCIFPNGHAGECVPLSDLADIDPRNGYVLSKGAVKVAQTRSAKRTPR